MPALNVVTVDPDELEVDIDLSQPGGATVTAYTNATGATPISLPATISDPTEFWLPVNVDYTFIVSVGGTERARTTIGVSDRGDDPKTLLLRTLLTLGDAAAGGGANSGASGLVEHVLDVTSGAWTAATNSSLPGAWTHAGGVISQTVDTADDALNYNTPLPARNSVIQFDVRFPTSQDAGTSPVGIVVAMSPPALDFGTFTAPITNAALLGLGGGLFALAAGDGTAFEAPPWVDGSIQSGTTAAAVTITQDAWHTVRIDADLFSQVVYIDGVYLVSAQQASGGNGLDTPNAGDCADRVQIGARGLVDFRNITVWTPALPA